MTFGGFVFLVVLAIVGIVILAIVSARKEREKIDAMSSKDGFGW